MTRRLTLAALGATILGLALTGGLLSGTPKATPEAAAEGRKLRVGTYDNRAIAIAYVPSKYHSVAMKKLLQQRDGAKERGDAEKVAELEAHGQWMQKKFHYQGFGHAPVGDLLAPVRDRLPEVARKAGVDVIAWECDYVAENVDRVDVTDLLVALYEPSEKTLQTVKQIRERDPISIEELDRGGHEH